MPVYDIDKIKLFIEQELSKASYSLSEEGFNALVDVTADMLHQVLIKDEVQN